MVRHQDVCNQFTRAFLKQFGENIDERLTAFILIKDWEPIEKIPSDKVQGAGEIQVGPFAGHEDKEAKLKERGQARLPDHEVVGDAELLVC